MKKKGPACRGESAGPGERAIFRCARSTISVVSEGSLNPELRDVQQPGGGEAVDRQVSELRAPVRRAPAARKPGEACDEEQRTERDRARGQTAAESLRHPAVGRDHFVDRAADPEQHQAEDDKADTGLRQREYFLLEPYLAHGSIPVAVSVPIIASTSSTSAAAVIAG